RRHSVGQTLHQRGRRPRTALHQTGGGRAGRRWCGPRSQRGQASAFIGL
ncbi:uncharacterized protein METZ01_LOCUS406587, partial [marine metagenome]